MPFKPIPGRYPLFWNILRLRAPRFRAWLRHTRSPGGCRRDNGLLHLMRIHDAGRRRLVAGNPGQPQARHEEHGRQHGCCATEEVSRSGRTEQAARRPAAERRPTSAPLPCCRRTSRQTPTATATCNNKISISIIPSIPRSASADRQIAMNSSAQQRCAAHQAAVDIGHCKQICRIRSFHASTVENRHLLCQRGIFPADASAQKRVYFLRLVRSRRPARADRPYRLVSQCRPPQGT